MMPFIRSLNELMVITHPRNKKTTTKEDEEMNIDSQDSAQRKRYLRSNNEKLINLPNLPKIKRRKWIRGKEVVSRFFNELDYNNQIQSSYELTLLGNQKTHDIHDVA